MAKAGRTAAGLLTGHLQDSSIGAANSPDRDRDTVVLMERAEDQILEHVRNQARTP